MMMVKEFIIQILAKVIRKQKQKMLASMEKQRNPKMIYIDVNMDGEAEGDMDVDIKG